MQRLPRALGVPQIILVALAFANGKNTSRDLILNASFPYQNRFLSTPPIFYFCIPMRHTQGRKFNYWTFFAYPNLGAEFERKIANEKGGGQNPGHNLA